MKTKKRSPTSHLVECYNLLMNLCLILKGKKERKEVKENKGEKKNPPNSPGRMLPAFLVLYFILKGKKKNKRTQENIKKNEK